MMQWLFRIAFAGLWLAASASALDALSVQARARVEQGTARIRVTATDTEGLDSLDISCEELGTNYHTAAPGRKFQRVFTLTELFPDLQGRKQLHVTVTVTNTRGQQESRKIRVPTTDK